MDEHVKAVRESEVTFAGKFIYNFLPYRRRIILSNIRQVYGVKLTAHEQVHLAKAFYTHLWLSFKETIKMRFMSMQKIADCVEVKGEKYPLEVEALKRGVLILTGHFGNWEFAPIGGILNFKQFQGRFHFIRRTLGSKKLERFLFKRYYNAGLNVIPKKNSLNQVCGALDKNHAVVFVLDQHASTVNRDGIACEFFGKLAGTYRSLASIARHCNLPVVPAASYRKASGQHVLEFYPPIPVQEFASSQEYLYKNTLNFNRALEQIILRNPAQWLWLHKRWKL